MKQLTKTLGVLITASALLVVFGCAREGPAERAGKQVDKAVLKTGEAVEALKEGAEQVGDATETTLEKTSGLVEDSADAISGVAVRSIEKAKQVGKTIHDAAERTAEEIQEATE